MPFCVCGFSGAEISGHPRLVAIGIDPPLPIFAEGRSSDDVENWVGEALGVDRHTKLSGQVVVVDLIDLKQSCVKGGGASLRATAGLSPHDF